ncbi:hypothetical protein Tco_1110136 [Tanacetum coccineum]|uniref:Uncharacterized protein n=1 Tax=Tanacetum coccineum TaxID=301880 RepID=A0ABQ5II40_9ASTR
MIEQGVFHGLYDIPPLGYILANFSWDKFPHWSKDFDTLYSRSTNHPISGLTLRQLRKLCNKIHGDVVPLPIGYLGGDVSPSIGPPI